MYPSTFGAPAPETGTSGGSIYRAPRSSEWNLMNISSLKRTNVRELYWPVRCPEYLLSFVQLSPQEDVRAYKRRSRENDSRMRNQVQTSLMATLSRVTTAPSTALMSPYRGSAFPCFSPLNENAVSAVGSSESDNEDEPDLTDPHVPRQPMENFMCNERYHYDQLHEHITTLKQLKVQKRFSDRYGTRGKQQQAERLHDASAYTAARRLAADLASKGKVVHFTPPPPIYTTEVGQGAAKPPCGPTPAAPHFLGLACPPEVTADDTAQEMHAIDLISFSGGLKYLQGHYSGKSSSPMARSGHLLLSCPARRSLVIFGGYGASNEYFNDVWEYFVEYDVWVERECVGATPESVPAPCFGHAGCLFADSFVFVHGGVTAGTSFLGTYQLDLRSGIWYKLTHLALQPSWGSSAVTVRIRNVQEETGDAAATPSAAAGAEDAKEEVIVLFGGSGEESSYNSVFMIHVRTGKLIYSRVKSMPLLEPRRRHGACVYRDCFMFVFGGRRGADRFLNDFWVFNAETRLWLPVRGEVSAAQMRAFFDAPHDRLLGERLLTNFVQLATVAPDVSHKQFTRRAVLELGVTPENQPPPHPSSGNTDHEQPRSDGAHDGAARVPPVLSDAAFLATYPPLDRTAILKRFRVFFDRDPAMNSTACARTGCTMACVGDEVFLFGGFVMKPQSSSFSDLHVYNVSGHSWELGVAFPQHKLKHFIRYHESFHGTLFSQEAEQHRARHVDVAEPTTPERRTINIVPYDGVESRIRAIRQGQEGYVDAVAYCYVLAARYADPSDAGGGNPAHRMIAAPPSVTEYIQASLRRSAAPGAAGQQPVYAPWHQWEYLDRVGTLSKRTMAALAADPVVPHSRLFLHGGRLDEHAFPELFDVRVCKRPSTLASQFAATQSIFHAHYGGIKQRLHAVCCLELAIMEAGPGPRCKLPLEWALFERELLDAATAVHHFIHGDSGGNSGVSGNSSSAAHCRGPAALNLLSVLHTAYDRHLVARYGMAALKRRLRGLAEGSKSLLDRVSKEMPRNAVDLLIQPTFFAAIRSFMGPNTTYCNDIHGPSDLELEEYFMYGPGSNRRYDRLQEAADRAEASYMSSYRESGTSPLAPPSERHPPRATRGGGGGGGGGRGGADGAAARVRRGGGATPASPKGGAACGSTPSWMRALADDIEVVFPESNGSSPSSGIPTAGLPVSARSEPTPDETAESERKIFLAAMISRARKHCYNR